MKYFVQNTSKEKDLITILFENRGILDKLDNFINPKVSDVWKDPFLLNDMGLGVERIIFAIKNNQKIMIFGDYDVDGITSSFILYNFIQHFFGYKNISIKYPDRIKDGYGIKKDHIEEMKNIGIDLIITVDNGITSVEEALYAKKLGIDLIITDHHELLGEIPQAFAVINPKISSGYNFKNLAGVGVVFKLLNGILSKTNYSSDKKNYIFNYYLPIVAIGTVSDIVPLVDENRLLVKKGLELINNCFDDLPESLKGILNYLKLNNIDTYHIGFVIGPRLNAGGRIESPYNSLYTLMYSGNKQVEYLERIESINTQRRKMQEDFFKKAKGDINNENIFLYSCSDEYHEGVIGIVSGKITDQFNKPSMIMCIQKDKGLGVASLRGPEYFSVIDMLKSAEGILEYFGGHKQAGGLTVKLENLDELIECFCDYCKKNITKKKIEKIINVDTNFYNFEWEEKNLQNISLLAPFGEGNPEPSFLFEDILLKDKQKVGTNGNGHLKLKGLFGDNLVDMMFWGKGKDINETQLDNKNIIGKVKFDNFSKSYIINGEYIL